VGGRAAMKPQVDISELSDDLLMCKSRVFTHSWDRNPAMDLPNSPRVEMAASIITARCTRCSREKFIYLDKKGNRMGTPYYRDPVNYPRVHRFSDQQFMQLLLTRSLMVYDAKPSTNGRKRQPPMPSMRVPKR
jgi:hypothetical protein